MTQTPSNVRREIARTRERMTETIDEIDIEISERVSAAKRKVDVMRLAREHPWPALSVALAIGAFIGGSGADEKAAAAAASAAKRVADGTSDAAKGVVGKFRQHRRDSAENDALTLGDTETIQSSPGLSDRLLAAATAPLAGVIDRLLEEMRVASQDVGARLARSGRNRAATATPAVNAVEMVVDAAPVATTPPVPRAEEAVPVPSEMLPTEVDARADAVEALGGGTHEPPLAPGAGDLGARWA